LSFFGVFWLFLTAYVAFFAHDNPGVSLISLT